MLTQILGEKKTVNAQKTKYALSSEHNFCFPSGAQSIHELDASRKSCRPPWRFWAGGEDCTDQSEKVIDSRELQAVCEQLGGEKRRKKPSTAWKTIRNCGGRVGLVAAPVVPVQFQRRPTVADRAGGPTRRVVAGGKGTRPQLKPAKTQFPFAGKRYAVAEPRFSTVRSSSTSFLARYLNSSANI